MAIERVSEPPQRTHQQRNQACGEVIPLPFVDLETVIDSVKMLRGFSNQDVLDCFNRAASDRQLCQLDGNPRLLTL